MLKFFTLLLSFISEMFRAKKEHDLREQGVKDAQDQLDENVAKANAAATTADPVRDERLRNRFDRSKQDKG